MVDMRNMSHYAEKMYKRIFIAIFPKLIVICIKQPKGKKYQQKLLQIFSRFGLL